MNDPEQLLTPAEVAAMFGVTSKTVSRRDKAGHLTAIKTLGGHRRYKASEVRRYRNKAPTTATNPTAQVRYP